MQTRLNLSRACGGWAKRGLLRWTFVATSLAIVGCADLASGNHAASRNEVIETPPLRLPALSGDRFVMSSANTSLSYGVFVRLPEGYQAQANRTYPVVYLLDGDSLFPILAPTHLFLTYDEKLSEAIIVGIAYGGFEPKINRREVDFSPPVPGGGADRGGAPAFLRFLRSELIPEVERRYRADPDRRVLLGQSRGGEFVLWSALHEPDLFWGRIASNPSFSSGLGPHQSLVSLPTRKDLRLIVATGTRDTAQRQQNARAWFEWQSARGALKSWDASLLVMEGGTHAATIGETYRRAMLALFPDR